MAGDIGFDLGLGHRHLVPDLALVGDFEQALFPVFGQPGNDLRLAVVAGLFGCVRQH